MNILITGGTGSLGSALARRWHDDHQLTLLSRNPHKQEALAGELPRARFVLADICNYPAVLDACRHQDVLVHTASLKVVGSGERHPEEYVRVNVHGSQVVARAWRETGRQRPALFINSDKAVAALNLYGMTKAVGEKLFLRHGFSSLRYGNVCESDGAFIHHWRQAAPGPILARCPEPTRFFLTMGEALALVEDALTLMQAGQAGVFVPHALPAFSVWDVAKATGLEVEWGLLLPGEKQHEVLLAGGEQAVRESGLLSRVEPGWTEPQVEFYSASTAHRMAGEEVLEVLGW